MKKGPFKLHQIMGAILLVAIVATGGFGSAFESRRLTFIGP